MSQKAQTGLISDVVIQLPAQDVEKSSGFALDIGSTVGKLIYRSNKEYKDGKPLKPLDDPSRGPVHFAMFPRDDVEGMVKYIGESADLTKNEDGVILVKSSGVGGQTYKQEIEKGLNCKMEVIAEMDCFIGAFLAMEKTQSEEELFIPPSAKVVAAAQSVKEEMEKAIKKMEATSDVNVKNDIGKDVGEDRPRLLVMAGSGSGVMQINKDGSFSFVDMTYTAGRFLYGLSSFLTGERDFSKLVKMAEGADGRTTGIWVSDLMEKKKEGDEDNMYNTDMADMLVFPFGKGIVTKIEDAKKEDLVQNVFDVVSRNHVITVLNSVRLTGATDVYVCGNVFNSEVMRDLFMHHKALIEPFIQTKGNVDIHFIKNGGCMGALGAFLNNKKVGSTA